MNIYKRVFSFSMVAGISALYGCSDSSSFDFDSSLATAQQQVAEAAAAAPPVALFDPASGDIPFPNSLLFSGTEDGTLNIPLGEGVAADLTVPQVSLNTLDGFSITSPITMQLSSAVDRDSLLLGTSVRMFEVQTADSGAVTQVISELNEGQVAVSLVGNTVAIVPLLPLKESADYMVLATNAIVSASGAALTQSPSFVLTSGSIELTGPAAALEPVRQLTNAMLAAASAAEVDPATVVQVFSFKTQSITPVMQSIKSQTVPQAITLAPTGLNTSNVNDALPGIADIYIGTLDIPYYRTPPANANDIVGINSFWQGQAQSNLTRFNPTPIATSVQTIPVLMTVPNANSGNAVPAEGWPIALFVHGITRDRSDLLAIADSLALAGIASIAIDQPMHGITDDTNPLSAAITPFTETERTFNIDLVDNVSGAAGPDGIVDDSGRHFFSPQFLLATRDNLRQSAADLLVLSASIANISAVPVNNARKTVIGYSLGGAAATPFLAFDDSITAASLAMPAAGLVGTTINSQAFGPPIIAGLSAAGIEQGTAAFSQFLVAAQTVVDAGDAINFGAMAAQNTPIHMTEVDGDTTVPNSVLGEPLVGTSALARVMGLVPAGADTTESAIVRFSAGDHGTLLSPAASPAATVEMQTQIATFAASSGGLVRITNADVIQQP